MVKLFVSIRSNLLFLKIFGINYEEISERGEEGGGKEEKFSVFENVYSCCIW